MNLQKNLAFQWHYLIKKNRTELKRLLILTSIFFSLLLILSLNRYQAYSSSDQGLFNQIFWNNLHGNFFQSSLSGLNAYESISEGKPPSVSFNHLGEHFVVDFLLWLPLYALFPSPVTLVILQVCLMTAGGIILYFLARHYLQTNLSLTIAGGYYAASAAIGPTLDNFYEQCQIPLFVFSLLLAMEKRQWWLFWLFTVLSLGIREDTGLILFGIGIYLLFSRRYPRVGLILCLLSFTYVTAITTVVMPIFSPEYSRLYLSVFFKKFVEGNSNPNALQILWGMLTHPVALIESIITPFDTRFFYLFKQWVPLAFVPAISGTTWILTGVPLLALFAQSNHHALNITIRYAIAIIPGVFYGAILWWSCHPQYFTAVVRRFWLGCITLSLILAVFANPSQAFYFLSNPFFSQFSNPIMRQWEHSSYAREVMNTIPRDATVSATTYYLVPYLSSRSGIVDQRMTKIQNNDGKIIDVDYLVADFWHLQYQKDWLYERHLLLSKFQTVDRLLSKGKYGIVNLKDGVVLLQKGVPSKPEMLEAWNQFRHHINS